MILRAIFPASQIPRRLYVQWAVWALLGAAAWLGGLLLIASTRGPAEGWRWALATGLLVGWQVRLLWKLLPQNHAAEQQRLYDTLGLANHLTLLRGLFAALLSGFLLLAQPTGWLAWAPGVLYSLVVLLDIADGAAARVGGRVTRLGAALDLNLDGLGVAIGAVLLVLYGRVPWVYGLVAAARYLFVFGLWLRQRRGLAVYDLPPSRSRRWLAAVQMGLIAVLLLPLYQPPATQIAALAFGLPFLAGFWLDWLSVSGQRQHWLNGLRWQRAAAWLPLALRAALIGMLGWWGGEMLRTGQFDGLTVGLLGIAFLGVLLGISGRSLALLAALCAGAYPYEARIGVLVTLGMVIFLFGTGRFTLWAWEDAVFFAQWGSRRQA